jgi:hypothetical protein
LRFIPCRRTEPEGAHAKRFESAPLPVFIIHIIGIHEGKTGLCPDKGLNQIPVGGMKEKKGTSPFVPAPDIIGRSNRLVVHRPPDSINIEMSIVCHRNCCHKNRGIDILLRIKVI